jgi:hypothetical protein
VLLRYRDHINLNAESGNLKPKNGISLKMCVESYLDSHCA